MTRGVGGREERRNEVGLLMRFEVKVMPTELQYHCTVGTACTTVYVYSCRVIHKS
ncbi:unnamed protein product [Chondrus crispus]|uniref:Uncharacterized protein n=1 Tax=Chondrus crispus TaxID=2769 RepID=R7QV07_CHOCR|nr:unnamed protein product [Chondrus crispus]CDF41316.1 unnamed protein product [Chondrus crispus]|eukprot:XP_005711610.1 unnamed protein product [Chondrus crispus]